MQQPAVDVVILSCNRLTRTLEVIDRVLAREAVRPKVFVLDQGSEPECLEALRRLAEKGSIFPRELGENKGVAQGRNIGMSLGHSEYIVSIDNDAIFAREDSLARVLPHFESDLLSVRLGSGARTTTRARTIEQLTFTA